MELTKKEIEHIALLARLELSDEEKARFGGQLSSIIDYVAQLQNVDTSDTPYEYQVEGLENVTAADEVVACSEETRDALLEEMPERAGDLLKVKGVFSL